MEKMIALILVTHFMSIYPLIAGNHSEPSQRIITTKCLYVIPSITLMSSTHLICYKI